MRITFSVDVELDEAEVIREGQRHGFTLQRVLKSIVADLECRIDDAIRWRNSVDRVGVVVAADVAAVARNP